jgi:membrane protease subunit (stomatin/prohibitin family)
MENQKTPTTPKKGMGWGIALIIIGILAALGSIGTFSSNIGTGISTIAVSILMIIGGICILFIPRGGVKKNRALLNVIEFLPTEDQRKDWAMYLYPFADFNSKSKLRINPGQVAIAVHSGKIVHVFSGETGQTELTTENYPFLKDIVSAVHGGSTPYDMKIYFLNATAVNLKNWRTPTPIAVVSMNPNEGNFRYRIDASGTYYAKIKEYQYFLDNVGGSLELGAMISWSEIHSLLMPKVNEAVKMNLIGKIMQSKCQFGEVATLIGDVSESIKKELEPKFAFFGIDLTDFAVSDLNIPDEDQKRYDQLYATKQKYTTMGEVGSQQMQSGLTAEQIKAVQTAAGNQGALGATMGIGLGAGLGAGLGSNYVNPMNQAQKNVVKIRCPKCGALNDEKAKFCADCGAPMGGPKCPKCGHEIPSGNKFCPNCGEKVN